jgi:hypothetical protein
MGGVVQAIFVVKNTCQKAGPMVEMVGVVVT